MAIGLLISTSNTYFSGFGFSYSTHGYYETLSDSQKMFSTYLTFFDSRVGISTFLIIILS